MEVEICCTNFKSSVVYQLCTFKMATTLMIKYIKKLCSSCIIWMYLCSDKYNQSTHYAFYLVGNYFLRNKDFALAFYVIDSLCLAENSLNSFKNLFLRIKDYAKAFCYLCTQKYIPSYCEKIFKIGCTNKQDMSIQCCCFATLK